MTTPAPVPDSFQATSASKKRLLWKWSLGATIILLLYLMWQCGSGLMEARSLSNEAVKTFHEELNNNRFDQIYNEAADGFLSGGKREELIKFLQAVHGKLGDAGEFHLRNVNVNATVTATFITTVYATNFTHGLAVETFTWVKSQGRVRLYGYNIQSNALVLN